MMALRAPVGGASSASPGWVRRVEPADGERLVLCDTSVVLLVSHPLDPRSVSLDSVRVLDPLGDLPGRVRLSSDGRLLIWEGAELLVAGAPHTVRVSGLRDIAGVTLQDHESGFTTCGLRRLDLFG
ncbi:MAG: hypothetical protein AB7Q30_12230 [Vicinamibacteria bacterium]